MKGFYASTKSKLIQSAIIEMESAMAFYFVENQKRFYFFLGRAYALADMLEQNFDYDIRKENETFLDLDAMQKRLTKNWKRGEEDHETKTVQGTGY